MDLIEQVEQNIVRHKLLNPASRVIVAVSGGVDSVVLLDLLCHLRTEHRWRLEVAHFNHQLRGAASDGDEEFVRALAEKLGVAFHVDRGDVTGLAQSKGISIEMAGRALRHLFLARIALERNSFQVALAHHADDQVETFWLRLFRGDVGAGLAGMRWRRQAVDDPQVCLVRPLLGISKKEVIACAKERGLAFREDNSNADLHYLRNRVRHEILPALEKYQPQLRSITLRAVEVLASEKDFLSQSAIEWLRIKDSPFEKLHPALQREVVRLQLIEMEVTPTSELIEGLRLSQDKIFAVSRELTIYRNSTGFVRAKKRSSNRFNESENAITLNCTGETWLGEKVVNWDFVEKRGKPERGVEYFDHGTIGEDVLIRRWRAGDRFQPIGSGQAVKLQNLFTNLKVPARERRERLVAVAQNGEIFWVEGIRIGEKFKVTPETRKILRWSWKHSPPHST